MDATPHPESAEPNPSTQRESDDDISRSKAQGFQDEQTRSRVRCSDAIIKRCVLIFLVGQNSSASLLMRYSRSQAGEGQWNSQTGVVMQEVIKLILCSVLVKREGALLDVIADKTEALKTTVPAIAYLIQNNLQYVAVSYLDASMYAVLYQLKILSTALLSVIILRKELSCIQWLALVLLTAGAALVVLSQQRKRSEHPVDSRIDILPGIVAVLTATLMSGLAGVYFEKLLKGSTVSLWTRNLQLAFYSSAVGMTGLYVNNPNLSLQNDFFRGYTAAAWLSIINNAVGGLLIAVVIKYADNILKNFSATLSIVLTALVSTTFMNSELNTVFCTGVSCVVYAVFLYNKTNLGAVLDSMPCSMSWFKTRRDISSAQATKGTA